MTLAQTLAARLATLLTHRDDGDLGLAPCWEFMLAHANVDQGELLVLHNLEDDALADFGDGTDVFAIDSPWSTRQEFHRWLDQTHPGFQAGLLTERLEEAFGAWEVKQGRLVF